MILSFTQDDLQVVIAAYKEKQATYGIPYCYLKGHSFTNCMVKAENLFITAHGDENAIGNEGAKVSITPVQLAAILKNDVLPAGHTGSIFVSACNSAPKYVSGLLAAMGVGYKGRIYGCTGAVAMALWAPGDNSWRLAIP